MRRPGKKWKVKETEPALKKAISESLNISPLLSQILINRGISDVGRAERFLSSTLSDLCPPFAMKGMKEAVERVLEALQREEKIAIYGDYDVDGITATAVLFLFLKKAGAEPLYYIPDRIREGYGLNTGAIRKLAGMGVGLIITADCGITNHEEVSAAKGFGLDVIITDHHEVPEIIPPALAVINPKQQDCPFPCKHLAGVGVAFCMVIALRAAMREKGFWRDGKPPNLKDYLDLVALGTVADVVPLTEDNRIFVKYGLMELSNSRKPGIMALKEVSGVGNGTINTDMVGYRVAPRINAAGRIGMGEDGVRLLISESQEEALEIAKSLDGMNRERQALEDLILREALEMIESDSPFKRKTIVLSSEKWHPGVIGIVASRIADMYYRPTVLISLKDGIGKGSARSIHSFMLYEGLKECSHLLETFGGHDYAAGLSIKADNIESFKEEFEHVASNRLSDDDLVPEIEIDAVLELNDVTEGLINQIEALAPFGEANPEPLLCSVGLDVANCRVVGNNHLKIKVRQNGTVIDAIGFGMGGGIDGLNGSKGLKIAFVPQINQWEGGRSIQLKLKDIRISH